LPVFLAITAPAPFFFVGKFANHTRRNRYLANDGQTCLQQRIRYRMYDGQTHRVGCVSTYDTLLYVKCSTEDGRAPTMTMARSQKRQQYFHWRTQNNSAIIPINLASEPQSLHINTIIIGNNVAVSLIFV
jgi:hypothetical protein